MWSGKKRRKWKAKHKTGWEEVKVCRKCHRKILSKTLSDLVKDFWLIFMELCVEQNFELLVFWFLIYNLLVFGLWLYIWIYTVYKLVCTLSWLFPVWLWSCFACVSLVLLPILVLFPSFSIVSPECSYPCLILCVVSLPIVCCSIYHRGLISLRSAASSGTAWIKQD